jgi:3-hydroxyisobutyrate dehydrogenase-like beta-hydroxyacid dehydrogenase
MARPIAANLIAAGFPLRHSFKDVRLALTAAGGQGVELPYGAPDGRIR